ncbi:MAG: hypothetical protein C0594_10280 [Marinilabiliales bacterium]|nr:MAG: hypothetical protein C0594_10280 [Marinilabiliales bacterium]
MFSKSGDFLKKNIVSLLALAFAIITLNACTESAQPTDEEIEEALEVEIDTSASTLVKFNNTLFSVPSPYEVAFLVKDLGIDYNKEFLNPIDRKHNYTNTFKKGLNLGVYGADLGYLNIYEQTPDAISYFSVVKVLSQELDISGAFDESIVKRVEKNMGNKDSLLFIISHAYRKADTYLENNKRDDIAALILTGGWVESLHIMSQICQIEKRQEIMNRIGEQKHPLDNLIKIMSPYYNQSEEYSELIDALIDLAYIFDGIDTDYTYIEPEVFPEEKLTIVNSKSNLTFTDDQIKMISEKINSIRNKIIE